MSTAQVTANKAAFGRFHEAVNTGDVEVISKTIDEVVDPDLLFHAPMPTGATGAQALKQVWAVLLQIRHLQRDLRRPLRRQPDRRDLGVVDVLSQMKQLGLIPA